VKPVAGRERVASADTCRVSPLCEQHWQSPPGVCNRLSDHANSRHVSGRMLGFLQSSLFCSFANCWADFEHCVHAKQVLTAQSRRRCSQLPGGALNLGPTGTYYPSRQRTCPTRLALHAVTLTCVIVRTLIMQTNNERAHCRRHRGGLYKCCASDVCRLDEALPVACKLSHPAHTVLAFRSSVQTCDLRHFFNILMGVFLHVWPKVGAEGGHFPLACCMGMWLVGVSYPASAQ
jgi:hypothetical protein